jgi:feruloyl esterase
MIRIAQYQQRHPEGWISPELLMRAQAAIIEAYDETDGAKDGIIHDDRNIRNFDTAILKKVGFTEAQIKTFQAISQPYDLTGTKIAPAHGKFPGYSITQVTAWSPFLTGTKAPPWKSTSQMSTRELANSGAPSVHFMGETLLTSNTTAKPGANYVKDIDFVNKAQVDKLFGTPRPDRFNLDSFVEGGGKLIYYHGVADEADPYLEAVEAFSTLATRYSMFESWGRMYAVPGMNHCRGGLGPQDVPDRALDAMVAWVEQGTSPQGITTRRPITESTPGRDFLLCPFPSREMLKPAGDPDKASGWECRAPAAGL